MTAPEVMLAEAGDVEAIESLVREAYEPYTARIGQPAGPLMDDYHGIVAQGRALVARRGERIIGLLVTSVHADHLLIENVAVSADERGTGVGSFLLGLAEDAARRAGVAEVRLYTNAAMTENLAFYPRRGFSESGRRRTDDGYLLVDFARRVSVEGV